MLEVSVLKENDEATFSAWLSGVQDAMVYYAPEFHRFLRAAVGGTQELLVARRDGDLVGAFPLFRRNVSGLGTIINSLPWYGSHGGCVLTSPSDDDARRALVDAYRSCISTPELLTATVVLSPSENAALGTYDKILVPRTHDYRIGQIMDLPRNGPEATARLEQSFLQKTRNLVRKSCKQGFEELVSDDDWAWRFLFETHQENLAAIGGRAKPWEHFIALRTHLPRAMRRLSVAMYGAEPVAAMLLVLFNRTVEYFTPVIKHDFRPLQPLSFLIWHGMREAIANSFRWWNWGGTWTNQPSLHHFKAGWGAADRPYTYLISLGPGSLSVLQARRDEIAAAFPYYYIYPFAELERDPA